jgi:hypothetical protein
MAGEMTMGALGAKFKLAATTVDSVVNLKVKTLAQLGVGFVKSEIQDMHAVDTGTMLNSTTAERVDKTNWLVGPTVFYAPYVALGTSRMHARPFHIEAAKKLMKVAEDYLKPEDLGL